MKRSKQLGRDDRQVAPQVEHRRNEYYENVSAGLGILQVVLYFALLTFVVLSLATNSNLITYRNFYYFFKDLDASADSVNVMQSDSVTYPTSDTQFFTLYRGGLAVVGNHTVSAFTAAGRQTVSESIQYREPMAEGRGRYLLVYEMGGTQYSLYNSYTKLYADKTDHPIQGVAVSDSGMYAILSSSGEYTSVISLYSDNFALINRYNKNAFVTDLSIDSKGKLLAMLLTESAGGKFESKLELYVPGESEIKRSVLLGDGMAHSCTFTSSGAIAIVFTDSVVFVSKDGEILKRFDFAGETLMFADCGEDGVAVMLQPSKISLENHLIVFDKNGKMLYNETVDAEVDAIARSGTSVFLLGKAEIVRVSVDSMSISSVPCQTDKKRILAVNESEVLLCSPQKAEYIGFDLNTKQ